MLKDHKKDTKIIRNKAKSIGESCSNRKNIRINLFYVFEIFLIV